MKKVISLIILSALLLGCSTDESRQRLSRAQRLQIRGQIIAAAARAQAARAQNHRIAGGRDFLCHGMAACQVGQDQAAAGVPSKGKHPPQAGCAVDFAAQVALLLRGLLHGGAKMRIIHARSVQRVNGIAG